MPKQKKNHSPELAPISAIGGSDSKRSDVLDRTTDARFRALFEQSSDALMVLDLDNNLFADCNRATLEMFHCAAKEQFLALHPGQVSPPQQSDGRPSMEKANDMIQIAIQRGSNTFEWTHRRADGEDFPAEVTLSLVPVGDKQVIYATVRDITGRKLMEIEIQRSEARFRDLAVSLSDWIWEVDAQGRYTYISEKVQDILGYTPAELLGKTPFDFVASDQIAQIAETFGRLVANKLPIVDLENWNLHKNGQRLCMLTNGVPLLDEAGNLLGYRGVDKDITARQQAEAELHRLTAILETTSDLVSTSAPDGHLTYLNKAGWQMLGWADTDDLSQLALVVLHPPWAQKLIGEVGLPTALREGSWTGETALLHRDGHEIPVSQVILAHRTPQGEIDYFSTIMRDISAARLVQDELRRSQERFSRMAANMREGITILEGDQIVYINDRLSEILGYSKEELTHITTLEMAAPEEKDRLQKLIAEVRQSGKTLEQFECWILRPDGSRRYIQNTYSTVLQNGQVVGRIVVITDLTERKLLEQQLQVSLERRSRQVQISTQVAQDIAAAGALDELFYRVVTLIKEQFGYYYTQLLRYDPAQEAVVLIAGYGQTGQNMLAAGHRIPLGQGLIGLAAASGESVLRPDLAAGDPNWHPNPLLPETRGEIAVPIKHRGQILGVLDVQSAQIDALTDEDRLLLEGLCGQIAIAVESTRLRQEMEERLNELNTLYRGMSRQAWQTFTVSAATTAGRQTGYYFDQVTIQPAADRWAETTRQAVQQLAPTRSPQESSAAISESSKPDGDLDRTTTGSLATVLALPLTVRGDPIGALAIHDDPQRPLTPEDMDLLHSVTEQIGLAVESARLFEQTQTSLAETQALYSIIAEMNAAQAYEDILTALAAHTLLNRADRTLLMAVFDRPGDATHRPEWIYPVAYKHSDPHIRIEIADRYPLSAFETDPGTLFTEYPVTIEDIATDRRLDTLTRTLYQQVFQAAGVVIVPLMLGSRSIGFVQACFAAPTQFSSTEIQRLTAVAGQAAIAVQSHLLLKQAQSRARQEQRIREVAAHVFSATDVDTTLRHAAEQIGRVLGTPAFIYLGAPTSEQEPPNDPS